MCSRDPKVPFGAASVGGRGTSRRSRMYDFRPWTAVSIATDQVMLFAVLIWSKIHSDILARYDPDHLGAASFVLLAMISVSSSCSQHNEPGKSEMGHSLLSEWGP